MPGRTNQNQNQNQILNWNSKCDAQRSPHAAACGSKQDWKQLDWTGLNVTKCRRQRKTMLEQTDDAHERKQVVFLLQDHGRPITLVCQ